MPIILPTGTTTANEEVILSVGPTAAYHLLLNNESAAAVFIELDGTATAGSHPCPQDNPIERRGLFHTIHVYSNTNGIVINGTSSGGIYLAVDIP